MRSYLSRVLIFLSIVIPQYDMHADNFFGPYKGKILRVAEGDTLFVEIEVWPGTFQRTFIRLRGIDTAEPSKLKGGRSLAKCEIKAAKKAIEFVTDFIADAKSITISHVSQIRSTANYVFARVSIDGKDLGQALLDNKHAISVTGLRHKRWSCRNF